MFHVYKNQYQIVGGVLYIYIILYKCILSKLLNLNWPADNLIQFKNDKEF
jgi:hypothetical protein